MSYEEEYVGDAQLVTPSDIRGGTSTTIADIIRNHYAIATNLLIRATTGQDLLECERALRTLEEEFHMMTIEGQENFIKELRKKCDKINPRAKGMRTKYRNLLWERHRIILTLMGREKMIPTKKREVRI